MNNTAIGRGLDMKWNVVSVIGWAFLFTTTLGTFPSLVNAQSPVSIHQATLIETDQKTKEVSTEELRKILLEKTATSL